MKYKLYDNKSSSRDPIERVLQNRGISDVKTYLNLTADIVQDYKALDNISSAVIMLSEHASANDLISIIIDEDVDGFCSAAMMYMYIKKVYPDCPVEYIMHTRAKSHEIGADIAIPENTKLLIVPDAGTNDIDAQLSLSKYMDIIILDHHELDEGIRSELQQALENVIIVNNQYSKGYKNKELCGAGIVYRFMQALDDYLWEDYADDFLDLCALANISDVMDMRSLETKYLTDKGLDNIQNKCFEAFINAQSYSMNNEITIHNVQWSITPVLNGMIRIGDITEKELLFRAFIETDETFEYKKRGTKSSPAQIIDETIYDRAARLCKNAKSRQDKLRDKGIEYCEMFAEEDGNKVLIIDGTLGIDRRLSGVIAAQVSEKHYKPCIILNKRTDTDKNIYRGSARNYDNCPIDSFKDVVNNNTLFSFARGHANAFGVEIDGNNIKAAVVQFNERLKDVEYDNTYKCDYILQGSADFSLIHSLCNMKTLIGQGINEPLIAIEKVCLNASDFSIIGKNNDTITFELDGVKYIKFKCDWDDEINEFLSDANNDYAAVEFTLVGHPCENVYQGKKTLQVRVIDWEVTGASVYGGEDEDDEW